MSMAGINFVDTTLSSLDNLKAKAEEKKKAEEAKIKENNKLGSLFGIDADNFTEQGNGSVFAGLGQVALAPLTFTGNVVGGILGGEIATINGDDNEGSGLSGFFGSIGTLFGGLGNILKGTAGALGNATQPQVAPQGGQAPSGTSSPSSTSSTDKTDKTSESKTEDKKDDKKTSSSTTTPKTSSSSISNNTSLGSFNYKYRAGEDGNLTTVVLDKAGKAVVVDTKGYEKVSSAVRTSVEEYNEASKDIEAAEEALKGLDDKIREKAKEVKDDNKKAYAAAKGNYDGAVKQVEYLQGKQDAVAADLAAMKEQLANCPEEQKSQIKASIAALEAQREEIKTQLESAIGKRDKAYKELDKAKEKLSDTKVDSDTNGLADLYAQKEAAKAKLDSAKELQKKAKTSLKAAVDEANAKYDEQKFKGEDGKLALAEQMKKDEAATSAITKALDEKEGDINSKMHKRSAETPDETKLEFAKEEAKELKIEVPKDATLEDIKKQIADAKATNSTPPPQSSETSSGQELGSENETSETEKPENESETNNEGEVDKQTLEAAKKYLTAKKITIAPNATSEEIMQQAILEWSKDLKDTGNEIYTGTIKPIYTKSMDTLSELFKGIFKVKEEAEAKKPETNTEGKAAEQTLEAVKEDLDNKLYPFGKPNYVKILEDSLKKANSK